MRPRPTPLLLAAAGLCWTLGQALLPDMGLEMNERYNAVAGHRGAETLATVLLFLAGCLLVLGALSIVRVAAERGLRGATGGRLIAVGAACLGLGGVWLVAGRAAFNMLFLPATHPEVSREAGLAVLNAPTGPEFIPLLLTLPALLLGPILLSIGLRRAGLVNWLPLALWVVGIGTFVGTEFTVKIGEVLGLTIASVALALLGRALAPPGSETSAARKPQRLAERSPSQMEQ